MVRKTRSTLKSIEKSKTESPKRSHLKASNQRGRSGSRSDDSEEEIRRNSTKNISPSRADKGSSDNESDKDSKKPLKKRSRSMAVKEETQEPSSQSKSRWDKQHKSSPVKIDEQDNDEEVKEDQNSKGKSKNKNNSNNDNVVNPETENENVQVTDESPSDAKDDRNEISAKNGEENKEIDDNVSKASGAELTSDEQSSEQNVEAIVPQDTTIPERASRSPSKETTDKSSNKHKSSSRRGSRERRSSERSKDSDKEHSEREERKSRESRSSKHDRKHNEREDRSSREPRSFEQSTNESTEQRPENKRGERNEDSRKIKLKRPPGDKRTSESNDREARRGEGETRKKITLKRPENKPVKEPKPQVEGHGSPPREQSQTVEWSSSYEVNNDLMDTQEKTEEKPIRKRITLKRSTVDDNTASVTTEKKEISLGRSISLPEHKDQRRSTSESNTPDGKRRRSSAFDRLTSENEEKIQAPKKPTKVIKINRVLCQESQEPPPPGAETFKKYKWRESDTSRTRVEPINLESLKQVCPTIEFLKEDEVNLDVAITETIIPKKERRKTFTELEAEEMEKIEAELNAEPEEIEIKENIIAMNRKISIVDDTASKMRPPPSPARNPVSEVLFITNLVRPFTVKQLKELLERTGKIREDGFWTDRIKSKCYVYYEKAEEAEATRNALHGVNWPIGNGKKLIIDYATVDDLENAKNPPIPVKKEKSPEKENKKPIVEDNRDDKKNVRTVKREWDLGKEDDHRRRGSRTRSRERQRKHSRRSYTPEGYHSKKRKHEEPAPQKAMDDLFLKTKATPSIYWQPLSPEEIALKQQQRQARLEENKRRLEEISRTSSRGTHRDRGRDRNFRRR